MLQPVVAPFDGFHESEHAVSGTCLISFDRNRYSVSARVVRRAVQVRAYADRIVVRCDGELVADHPRFFGCDRTIHDPWHYLPVLVTRPGALRGRRTVPGLGAAACAGTTATQARHRGRCRSAVLDAVLGEVAIWQQRPPDRIYPLVFFDALAGEDPRRGYLILDRSEKEGRTPLREWTVYNRNDDHAQSRNLADRRGFLILSNL